MLGTVNKVEFDDKAIRHKKGLGLVYALFAGVGTFVFYWIAEGEFSCVLTLSALFQLLAFCLLAYHVGTTGSIRGISTKTLQLEAIALACKLSSTTWLLGYLPADATGDYLYQAFDIVSLFIVLVLLYRIRKIRQTGNGETSDETKELPAWPFVAVCFALGCALHADLDERPIFDILWATGLFLTSVAAVPYLWLMAAAKAPAPALTSHFVAMVAISRILSGAYVWDAHEEFTCVPYIGTFNHAGHSFLAAHGLHLLLLFDFAYCYVKSLAKGGLNQPMEIRCSV